jgi:acyl-CoA synthetase (AMP-forming)/AMP-acid ligase II
VTGRIKDLLVIRGRNVQPHDVEDAAARAGPLVRPGGGVAFALAGPDGEVVGLIQETTATAADFEPVAGAIRRQVAEELQVAVDAVWLVAPRSVAKTSSGKLRRGATRDALLAGELPVLFEHRGATRAGSREPELHAR